MRENNDIWGADNFLFLDIWDGYTNGLAFKKFINLYSYGLCMFLYVCYASIFLITLKILVDPQYKMAGNHFLMR